VSPLVLMELLLTESMLLLSEPVCRVLRRRAGTPIPLVLSPSVPCEFEMRPLSWSAKELSGFSPLSSLALIVTREGVGVGLWSTATLTCVSETSTVTLTGDGVSTVSCESVLLGLLAPVAEGESSVTGVSE